MSRHTTVGGDRVSSGVGHGRAAVAARSCMAKAFATAVAVVILCCPTALRSAQVEVLRQPAPDAPATPAKPAATPLASAPEATDAPVLDLRGDGFSVGKLLDVPAVAGGPRTTLLWQSDLFAKPLEFAIPEIVRIRFPRGQGVKAEPGDWRFELRGGDTVVGGLEGVDAEWFTVAPRDIGGAGPVRVRRGAVERMRRLDAATRTILPGSLDGWDAVRGVWQEQAGMLASDRPGAVAFRDVGAPAKACYDVVLSWTTRPDFDLYVATDAEQFARIKAPVPGKKPADIEEYRLQGVGGKVQAWREGAKADFGEITPLDAAGGRLHLQVFVDQETGRMAVSLPQNGQPADKPAFDKTVAPRKPAARPGFAIKLRKGTIRIDSLRVLSWDGGQPRLEPVAGLGSRTAVLESFDKAAGEFVVRDGAETRRVAVAAAGDVEFPADQAGPAPDRGPAAMLFGFAAGSRLIAAVREITMGKIVFESPFLEAPVVCPLDRVSLLESVGTGQSRMLPGRVGLLESAKDRMLGCMGQADGVGWQPLGAGSAAPFAAAQAAAKISFRGTALLGGAGLTLSKVGNEWSVAEIAPGGPAARDGRIQRGWKLEAIQLLPGGGEIAAAGLNIDHLVPLLRGIVGSAVGLRLKDPQGAAHEVTLIRDRAGRGDVGSVPEQDLLAAADRALDDKSGIKPAGAAAGSRITLKTGDAIFGTVVSGNAEGLRVRMDHGGETMIPAALLRAAELVNTTGMPITPQKMERLTTLPRMQVADPPTHMIRLDSGDYLRGKLLSLDADTVKFRVLEETKEFPRTMLARIIWLTVAGDGSDQKAVELMAGGAGLPVQAVAIDKRRLTVAAERVEDGRLVGTAGPIGQLQIELKTCEALLVGAAIAAQPPGPNSFKQWELKPAKPPAALIKK